MVTNGYYSVDTKDEFTKYYSIFPDATFLINYTLANDDFFESTEDGIRAKHNSIVDEIVEKIHRVVNDYDKYIVTLDLGDEKIVDSEKLVQIRDYRLSMRGQQVCLLLNRLWKLNKKQGTNRPVIVVGITEYEISIISNYIYGDLNFDSLPHGAVYQNESKVEMQWDKELCVLFYVEKQRKSRFPFYTPYLHLGISSKHISFNYIDNLNVEIKEITTDMRKVIYELRSVLFESSKGISRADNEDNQLISDKKEEYRKSIHDFISNCRLVAFDTVITRKGYTLFNLYALACLEQDIIPPSQIPFFAINGSEEEDLSLPAFKIQNLHTKIGANIHVKDFYYDSKMFQNSFFSNRFACEIVKYLLTETTLLNDVVSSTNDYEIIGYGKYSELLVSQIWSVLQRFTRSCRVGLSIAEYKDNSISLNTINEPKRSDLSSSKIHKKYIIVIPVSITSTTKVDIVKKVLEQHSSENTCEIFAKISAVKIYSNENSIMKTPGEHYVILSRRDWHFANECVYCFPDKKSSNVDPSAEMPLVEIKKKYKSPIIFNNEFPFSGSRLEKYSLSDEVLLMPEHYSYGYSALGREYIHYINSFKFFDTYKEEVREWLQRLKDRIVSSINPNRKVALVALEGNFNHAFASMINEVIFSNKAVLIHHNTDSDFIENSKGFYKDIVATSDLYYVDDLMLTGRTFMSFNNFIRQIWYDWDIEQKPFKGVFNLIVCSYDFAINQVSRELSKNGKIYVFKQLRVPPLFTYENMPNPIHQREEMYLEIAEKCNLDRQKIIFLNRAYQLKNRKSTSSLLDFYSENERQKLEIELDDESIEAVYRRIKTKLENRDLCKVIISDIIFGVLSKDFNRLFGNSGQLKDLVDYVFDNLTISTGQIRPYGFDYNEWKEMIIKVISVPPFTYYSNIQSAVMRWMILECESTMSILCNTQRNKVNIYGTHYQYRYLKLLFRRLSNFKSTYLLRKQTIEKLSRIYKDNRSRKEEWFEYTTLKNEAIAKIIEIVISNRINLDLLKTYLNKIRVADAVKILNGLPSTKVPGLMIDEITENKLAYYFQIVRNCNDLFSILHGSPSFITSCVKEIIHESKYKAGYLNESLKAIYASTHMKNDNPDFEHLLLLLYLENTQIDEVKEDVEIIKLINSFPDFGGSLKTLVNGTSNRYESKKVNNTEPSAVLDEFMTNFRGIFRSGLGIENPEIDLMIRIADRSMQRTSDFWLIGESFYTPVLNPPSNIPDKLVTMMFDKILDSSGLPQTFVLFKRQGTKWESFLHKLQRKVNSRKHEREEFQYINYDMELVDYTKANYNLLFCFRVSSLEYHSTNMSSPQESTIDNKVIDTTQAVIFVGVKGIGSSKIDFPTFNSLRKAICIKDTFSNFLRTSIQNDAFPAYIDKMGDGMRIILATHSIDEYDKMFRETLKQYSTAQLDIEKLLIMHVLGNQSAILNRKYEKAFRERQNKHLNKESKNITNVNVAEEDAPENTIDRKQLEVLIKNIYEVVLKHQENSKCELVFDETFTSSDGDFSIRMDKDLIIIFISEVFINISRLSSHTKEGIVRINIKISEFHKDKKTEFCLEIRNNYSDQAVKKNRIVRQQKYVAGSKSLTKFHGLQLINYFYSSIFNYAREKNYMNDEPNRMFYTYLPLINYKHL